MKAYEKLEARFSQYTRLNDLLSIAAWDEAAVMPEGAGPARGRSLAELEFVLQNLVADPLVGEWINEAKQNKFKLSDWQLANLRAIERRYIQDTAVPPELNKRLSLAKTEGQQAWRKLRAENDWKSFLPKQQEILTLTREMLSELSKKFGTSLYDTALNLYAHGMDTTTVEKLFGELKNFLPELTQAVVEKQKSEKVIRPDGKFPFAAQKALALELMAKTGFDFDHGRLDESHHPFCGGNARDVRITNRYSETDFISGMMGILHETGHGIYEQNLPKDWIEQPVGSACGMALHESQSLLMEMQVVRSREFLTFAEPFIRKHLGSFVKNPECLSAENLARLVTRVKPGLIRVDADEVTYPAHVILRFEIERDLIEDRWPLSELPAVWNEKMTQALGLNTLGNDRNGCMQDVHWPSGAFGYFPDYTFGAVIAAQLFAKAESEHPDLRTQIASGDFSTLQNWLREKIWERGALNPTLETVSYAAGPLAIADFQKHLLKRYQ